MKNYKVEYYPSAYTDLEKIGDYIAFTLCAPGAAINLIDKIQAAIEKLKAFPKTGKALDVVLPLKYAYRWLKVENYMIFYTLNENTSTISIVRILYGASDYLSEL
ncbi:MAG: type II toxin-antitoxin system RelE/ParE family toxin [Clostridia bacterium]|nr:type II toxin-antitoxin system RelE/ParE family toxin [Clostridia bacterium]